jgi:Leucine-rich repeat (LRR) protein
LYDNNLVSLDNSVSKVSGVKRVYLNGNPIKVVPIEKLKDLEFICLSLDSISELKAFLKRNEKLFKDGLGTIPLKNSKQSSSP